MTATSSSTGSSREMRLGFRTSPQKPSSSRYSVAHWQVHWRYSGSPKGILLIDFLPRVETVNVDRYCETLQKLRRAIQNKRRGMLNAGVVLLRDNARPHMARRAAAVLTKFCWELLKQPPTALILLSAIFTFSCISRNSCPPSSWRVARQVRRSDLTVRMCWDQWTEETSFTRRLGSEGLRQANRREDRQARVEPISSIAAVQTQAAPSPQVPVSSRTISRRTA
ncbi:uncharacterized protein TNCV_1240531 [Trichonephila clavipes]|uniref:Transposase n=1 Tax=Trichonephila clavipes TaxID=2585209 RepID=A0A8X6WDU9_TRICX|nr:uncharacterized protein TNCV_1240531 [Trichonephila clavipes]